MPSVYVVGVNAPEAGKKSRLRGESGPGMNEDRVRRPQRCGSWALYGVDCYFKTGHAYGKRVYRYVYLRGMLWRGSIYIITTILIALRNRRYMN